MVLKVEGGVKLHAAKGPIRDVRVMDMLYVEERLATPEGGQVMLVFFKDGQREQVKAKTEATIGEKGCQPAGAVERLKATDAARAVQPGLDELKRSSRGAVSVFRSSLDDMPPTVSPMQGATIVTDRPTLVWTPAEKAKAYRVELIASGSNRLIWRAEATEARLSYPDKQKPLTRGRKYEWRVTAELGEELSKLVAKSDFSLATAAEAEELAKLKPLTESKDAPDLILAAATYHAYGVYGEALAIFERLAEVSPKEPAYQAARAAYYERGGRRDDAKKAWTRAKELGFVLPAEEGGKP
jgi:tetratricopeptide (TPR) repeat protein